MEFSVRRPCGRHWYTVVPNCLAYSWYDKTSSSMYCTLHFPIVYAYDTFIWVSYFVSAHTITLELKYGHQPHITGEFEFAFLDSKA